MPRCALRFYPTKDATDLTDEQWAAIVPLVATLSPNGGCPTEIGRRVIVNAMLYENHTGCQWRILPNDVIPMSSVRYYFDTWNRDGTCIKINNTLRKLARQALNRNSEPSINVLDCQSLRTTEAGGERGYDGGKSQRAQTATLGLHRRVLVARVGTSHRHFGD